MTITATISPTNTPFTVEVSITVDGIIAGTGRADWDDDTRSWVIRDTDVQLGESAYDALDGAITAELGDPLYGALILADFAFSGRYGPQEFVTRLWGNIRGIDDPECLTILNAGPDHPDYWNCWDELLESAAVTLDDGRTYRLHYDPDNQTLLGIPDLEPFEITLPGEPRRFESTWTIQASSGCIWWPDPDTSALIESAPSPIFELFRQYFLDSTNGEWKY